MNSKYLTKLNLLKDTGYFTGLKNEKFYDVLKYNYESGNAEEKAYMDANADLLLDRYRNGIVQTNLIYNKISAIHGILVFFLIVFVLSIIVNLVTVFKTL